MKVSWLLILHSEFESEDKQKYCFYLLAGS